MAQQYAGLCIGGPLAGQSSVQRHRSFHVDEWPVVEIGQEPVPESATVTRHVYLWHHTGAQGLWIPSGESLHDAINTMAMAYVEKCNAGR